MDDASLSIALAGLLVALLAIIVALYALGEARKSNALPGALDFLGQYRDLATDRRLIVDKLDPPHRELSDIPVEIRDEAVRVSHYLDHLGFLVEHDFIDLELVASFMGGSITRLWGLLSEFIGTERERRGGEAYQVYFQKLAQTMREIQASEARRLGG